MALPNRKSSLVRNAIANLARGFAGAFLLLLLPPVLARSLPHDRFSAWALILQIAGYITILDLGTQVAVARFVARATARKNEIERDAFFHAALLLLCCCAAAGLVLTFAAVEYLSWLFPAMPTSIVGEAKISVLAVAGSSALSLPASAVIGLFLGLERNVVPAAVVAGGKLAQCVVVTIVALTTHDLTKTAVSFGCMNLLVTGAHFAALYSVGPRTNWRNGACSRPVVVELLGYCSTLSVWAIAMVLVAGLDVVLVGRFDFYGVAAYSVAATLITPLGGAVTTVFNVLVARSAGLQSVGERDALGRLFVSATKGCVFLLTVLSLPLVLAPRPLLQAWVGADLAEKGAPILLVLSFANIGRLSMVPYAAILMGTGEQRFATGTAIMEGTTNLIASIILGQRLGAIGVAWGTLVGTIFGVSGALFINLPRTREIGVTLPEFARRALLPSATPLTLLVAGYGLEQFASGPVKWQLAFVTAIAIVASGSRLCFDKGQRQFALARFQSIMWRLRR